MIEIYSWKNRRLNYSKNPAIVKKPEKNEKKWIILTKPTTKDYSKLKKFNIHDLTIEDCKSHYNFLKYEEFDNYTYFSSKSLTLKKNSEQDFDQNPIHFINSKNYLITILPTNNDIIKSLILNTNMVKQLLSQGEDYILHKIYDIMIDNLVIIKEKFNEKIEKIEDHILNKKDTTDMKELFLLESKILKLKNYSEKNNNIIIKLSNGSKNYLSPKLKPYFKDILDHIHLVDQNIEYTLIQIGNLRDNYQAIVTNDLNRKIKLLTVFTAMLLPLTLITGYYGMNIALPFQNSINANFYIFVMFIVSIIITIWFFGKEKLL